uniref:Uncharacterized protein n=1 Tax=Heterorhabditis bacteriophora TaxID=37862 RepID=A0A1I7X3I6_HETBA
MFTKYSSEQMVFDKILLPETSFLHFCVWQKQHSGNSIPIAHRMLPIDKLNNEIIIDTNDKSRNLYLDIHSALMDPFSSAIRSESLSWALGNPFADPQEVAIVEEVDDSYRQSIIGTTKQYTNSISTSTSQEREFRPNTK